VLLPVYRGRSLFRRARPRDLCVRGNVAAWFLRLSPPHTTASLDYHRLEIEYENDEEDEHDWVTKDTPRFAHFDPGTCRLVPGQFF
jgi:hypothetical protein